MGRMYSVQFNNVTVSATAAQDLFEIVAPSDASVALHSIVMGQTSDVGDAAAENLRWLIIRGYTVSGSGGSAPTATPLAGGDAAFGGTTEVNNTTVANTGTVVTVHADVFNIALGIQYRPTPEERIIISPSVRLVVNLPTGPTDALTCSGTAYFEAIGG